MKLVLKIILLTLLNFNTASIFAQDDEWKLKKDDDGIIVYSRKDKISGNIEFKATSIYKTSVGALLKVFYDIEGYTRWMADVKVSKVLKKVDSTEHYLYMETEVPWHLKNRDITFYQNIIRTGRSVKITLEGKPNYIAHKEGIIRIEYAKGYWEFIPLPNNKAKVIYQLGADPGLNIPDWILNLFIVDGPFETLRNLKGLVEP